MTKIILCYGDSNTWGQRPDNGKRYAYHERWTGILQQQLGKTYRVIEEGLSGRTTIWDDPVEYGRNGATFLPIALESHSPIDLIILLLGTNDLKARLHLAPIEIGQGIEKLIKIVRVIEQCPDVLLVTPPPLINFENNPAAYSFGAQVFANGYAKSLLLHQYYHPLAEHYGCSYVNAGEIVETSRVDGIHWDKSEHQKFGRALANEVLKIIIA